MNNILFYSNKCNYCTSFISLLEKENLMDSFKKVCIDNNSNIPDYLQKVPTIMIENVTKPLVGKHAFNWVHMQSNLNNRTNNINNIVSNNFKETQVKGPGGFTEREMTGISDTFSFIKEKNDVKKSYNFVDNNDDIKQEQEQEETFNPINEVLTRKNQTKHLDQMVEQRKIQDQEFVENDDCDDVVDLAYNSVTYTKKSSDQINNINNSYTRKPKRDNPVFVKKINSGIAGYKFNKF